MFYFLILALILYIIFLLKIFDNFFFKWNYIFLGANFSPVISGPPPKPAPPSFPNSPVAAGISPVKVPSVSATTVVPSVQSVQSMNASAIGKTTYVFFIL